MEVFVYPLKKEESLYWVPGLNLCPDFSVEPKKARLINYVAGTKTFTYRGFDLVGFSIVPSLKSDELPCDYAFVEMDGEIAKVRADQVSLEKVLNEYQKIFRRGVNKETLDEACAVALENIKILMYHVS